jgi:hypothetical protein
VIELPNIIDYSGCTIAQRDKTTDDCRSTLHLLRTSKGSYIFVCSPHRLHVVRKLRGLGLESETVRRDLTGCALTAEHAGAEHGSCAGEYLRMFTVKLAGPRPQQRFVWLCTRHAPAGGDMAVLPAGHPVLVWDEIEHAALVGHRWDVPSAAKQLIELARRRAHGLADDAEPALVRLAEGHDAREQYRWARPYLTAYKAMQPDGPDDDEDDELAALLAELEEL